MMHWIRNFILLALMLAASAGAVALRPTKQIAKQASGVDLARVVPLQIGEWREERQQSAQIVDPQQQETIDKIYTQTLSRTYVNDQGRRIMLSLAYGTNQSDGMALHAPEVCYPSQGFALLTEQKGILPTSYGDIRVKRLMMQLGQRFEPVTYWTMLGHQVVQGGFDTKLTQLRYGFRGEIPDGLLFRVSSITSDADAGYAEQQRFVREFVAGLSDSDRLKFTGLSQSPMTQ